MGRRVKPDDYLGGVSGVLVLGAVAAVGAKAIRDDYSDRRSVPRAFLHPGFLVLSALISFVLACVWAGYSFSLGSFVLFLLSTVLASGAALSLELRRGRPTVGIGASLGVGVGWFLLRGFLYISILFHFPGD